MIRTLIALLIIIGATLSVTPRALANCSGCEGASPQPPAPPAVPYDYKECKDRCHDKATGGSATTPISLTLPGIGANTTNCSPFDTSLKVTFDAEAKAEIKTKVEAGIAKLISGSVEITYGWSVQIGFECAVAVPGCSWASVEMDFGIVGTADKNVVERMIKTCCSYYKTKKNIFGWDWPVPDKFVAHKCGAAVSCGLQSKSGSVSLRIGAECEIDGGDVSEEQCPNCGKTTECEQDVPQCVEVSVEGEPTEACCESGTLVEPGETTDSTDDGDSSSDDGEEDSNDADEKPTKVFAVEVQPK
jgi:hypothetical protein